MDDKEILNSLMSWRTRLVSVSWSVLRDSHLAEDIFQDLLLKAFKSDAEFENERALISWSVVTIRRASIDQLRKKNREVLVLDEEVLDLLDKQMLNSKPFQESLKRDALESCMNHLPERSVRVLKLRYYYGHDCQEVANRTKMSIDAVYKLISRVHTKLRRCIELKLSRSTIN